MQNDLSSFSFTGTLIGNAEASSSKNGRQMVSCAFACHETYTNAENKKITKTVYYRLEFPGSPKYAALLVKGTVIVGTARPQGVSTSESGKSYILLHGTDDISIIRTPDSKNKETAE